MEAFLLWLPGVVGFFAAVLYLLISAISGINYLRKEWRIRKDKLKAKREGKLEAKLEKLEKLEAELEKLRAENFNFRVVRAIRKKFRERGRGLGN